MRLRLLLLWLLVAPALSHPGDHDYLRLQVRGQEVRAELEVPGHLLAALDRDGDFLISPEELQAGREALDGLLRDQVRLSSQGLAVAPRVEPAPRRLWRPGGDLSKKADTPVGLVLTYRWPWEVRSLDLDFRFFARSANPDCSVSVQGLGALIRLKLDPTSSQAHFGTPSNSWQPMTLWVGLQGTLLQALPWLLLLALVAGSSTVRPVLAFIPGFLVGLLAGAPSVLAGLAVAAAALPVLLGRLPPQRAWLCLLCGLLAGGLPMQGLQADLPARLLLGLGSLLWALPLAAPLGPLLPRRAAAGLALAAAGLSFLV